MNIGDIYRLCTETEGLLDELNKEHNRREWAKLDDYFAMNIFLYVLYDNMIYLYHNGQRKKIVV